MKTSFSARMDRLIERVTASTVSSFFSVRSGGEALALKWNDVDFVDEAIRIRQSKTFAGIRSVPMSGRCKAELLRWRERLGPEFSEYVFPNPQRSGTHLTDVRRAWPKALEVAGVEFFWL